MKKLNLGKKLMFISQLNISFVLICVLSGILSIVGLMDLGVVGTICMILLFIWIIQVLFLDISKDTKLIYIISSLAQLEIYLFLNPWYGYHNKYLLVAVVVVYLLALRKYASELSKRYIQVAVLNTALLATLLIMLQLVA